VKTLTARWTLLQERRMLQRIVRRNADLDVLRHWRWNDGSGSAFVLGAVGGRIRVRPSMMLAWWHYEIVGTFQSAVVIRRLGYDWGTASETISDDLLPFEMCPTGYADDREPFLRHLFYAGSVGQAIPLARRKTGGGGIPTCPECQGMLPADVPPGPPPRRTQAQAW
jgi:hypothetical protein